MVAEFVFASNLSSFVHIFFVLFLSIFFIFIFFFVSIFFLFQFFFCILFFCFNKKVWLFINQSTQNYDSPSVVRYSSLHTKFGRQELWFTLIVKMLCSLLSFAVIINPPKIMIPTTKWENLANPPVKLKQKRQEILKAPLLVISEYLTSRC